MALNLRLWVQPPPLELQGTMVLHLPTESYQRKRLLGRLLEAMCPAMPEVVLTSQEVTVQIQTHLAQQCAPAPHTHGQAGAQASGRQLEAQLKCQASLQVLIGRNARMPLSQPREARRRMQWPAALLATGLRLRSQTRLQPSLLELLEVARPCLLLNASFALSLPREVETYRSRTEAYLRTLRAAVHPGSRSQTPVAGMVMVRSLIRQAEKVQVANQAVRIPPPPQGHCVS